MSKIHILHVIHRLSMGGLENGLVNLVNGLDPDRYEHTVLSLTTEDQFALRFKNPVKIFTLNKKPGPLSGSFKRLYSLIKKLKPDVMHTRNFSTLECQLPAFLARVPYRVHSEHGRDHLDLEGQDSKKLMLRRFMKPFVHHYIALSKDLEQYLKQEIRISDKKITQIYNGVDLSKFKPVGSQRSKAQVVLAAGRLSQVKDFKTLIEGFAHLNEHPDLRLWIAGEGPQEQALNDLVTQLGIAMKVHFLGHRTDLPELMSQADIYVQTSLFEGISNTVLEAMASGLPIVTTRVGGNPELVQHEEQGFLIEPQKPIQLAYALEQLLINPELRAQYGQASRQRAMNFDLTMMIEHYDKIYGLPRGEVCAA